MNYRFFILALASLALSSCSLYPLGHSKYGNYYGGQGNATAPRTFLPRDIQRQEPIL